MDAKTLVKLKLPDTPGVYEFIGSKGKILYIGKATSLRDRVRSYFANDLLVTRGKHILDMVSLATTVRHHVTDSAIEALILEASMIKKHQPEYNTKEKDDRSFNYVVITKEDYPIVMTIRERSMLSGVGDTASPYRYAFGPFTSGGNLGEALKIVRRIFPFRDEKCVPLSGKPCFNRQIGLCPGVCTGEISKAEYGKRIQHIKLFFEGKKSEVARGLKRLMHAHAKKLEFEEASEYKRMLFALDHIKDVSLLDNDIKQASQSTSGNRRKPFRIEAYDIAHISGTDIVGVMTVVLDGAKANQEYRKFKIRSAGGANDTLHLEEVLRRRLAHGEWQTPDIIVVDGGIAQKRRAMKVLQDEKRVIPVLSVVKDDRHRPKAILGDKQLAQTHKLPILLANAESHRFAVSYHRLLRGRAVRKASRKDV